MMRYLVAGIIASLLAIFLAPVAIRFGKWLGTQFEKIWNAKMHDDDETR